MPTRASDVQIDLLLQRLAATAVRYRSNALNFTCDETIRWFGARSEGGRQKFGYVFVFEEGQGFTDYRTRLRRNASKKPPKRVDPLDFNVPRHLWSPYLWVFTFREERQARHEYSFEGKEIIDGRSVVKIAFEPVPPIKPRVNDWYGVAWIDEETAQLIKIEAHSPEDQQILERMEKHLDGEAVTGAFYTLELFTTEFAIVEHGLRYPSRVELRRERYDVSRKIRSGPILAGQPAEWSYDTIPMLQVIQTYKNYRFFGVSADPQVPLADQ